MIFSIIKLFYLIILFLTITISSLFSFNSVCDFPLLNDRLGCQRGQSLKDKGGILIEEEDEEQKQKEQKIFLNNFDWFCDPESSISMSEGFLFFALEETINKLINIYGKNCVCSKEEDLTFSNLDEIKSENNYCWHRFGFGFLKKLNLNNDVNNNINLWINNYGNNFVNILRERWGMGNCGEDIVILFVQIPPIIFVSAGSLIKQRLGINKINQLINQTNIQLLTSSKPPFRILSNLIENIGILLVEKNNLVVDNNNKLIINKQQINYNQVTTTRSHIPLWAWAVFGACGVAFLLMALGLFAITRTNTRRGCTQGKKFKCQGHAAMVARRHWKEEQLQPAQQTYVNLVQMLMPHPKAPPTNMPQQV
ncbi:unnamed protein product [Meloidogyne enterolobii]|uniref:Uncharacterized protein n=1 Tax=Meloidogyne enterolobii TaxID=390850 RepID=A0ACB1AGN4_MELEN